ncbi:MAG: hypothetical protein KAI70_05620 [Candidatus Omnitrophica bacterium]|nr:hypothetical protein [Candidatus Omnitrophota bacterium]
MKKYRRWFVLAVFVMSFILVFGVDVGVSSADMLPEVSERETGLIDSEHEDTESADNWWETASGRKRFRLNMGAKSIYDSNVFNYSRDEIDLYDADSNSNRFDGVKSIDDVITELSIIGQMREEMFDIGPTTFSVGTEANIYSENTDRTYMKLKTSVRQNIGKDNIVRGGYTFIPDYFIRTLYDGDQAAGDRYRKLEFTTHAGHLKYWNRLSDIITWWLRGTYEYKDYNEHFQERDTHAFRLTCAMAVKPEKWYKINPYFRYFWNSADGTDDEPDIDSDISRDGFDTGGNLWFYPESKFSYMLGYGFRWTQYDSSNSIEDDPYHSGRKQDRHRIKGRVKYALRKNIDLFTEYAYEIRNVDVKGADTLLEEESILEYDKHVGTVGIAIRF